MSRKLAFTLIELLVVIAIIAILAALLFPVFMKTKESAYRNGDMSNMNAIRNALQLYRVDQGAYPPQILGYASFYDPGLTQVVPANRLREALYPKRIDSINTLKPAYDRPGMSDLTIAVWPNQDPRGIGTAPIKDLDGDGQITAADDLAGARQAYGTNTYFCEDAQALMRSGGASTCPSPSATTDAGLAAQFYKVSGYDVGQVKAPPPAWPVDPGSTTRWELHYARQWSSYAMLGGSGSDDPRQLIYSDPPDDTVITWNSWFRDYNDNLTPQQIRKDFVLFLGGGARPYDSKDIYDRSWRVTP